MKVLSGTTIIDGKLRIQVQAEFPLRISSQWSPMRYDHLQREILSFIAEYVKASEEVDAAEKVIDGDN